MKKIILILLYISIALTGCADTEKASQQIVNTETAKVTTLQTTVSETVTEIQTTVTEPVISETKEDKLLLSELIDKYNPETIPECIKNIEWTEDMVIKSEEELVQYVDKYTKELKTVIPFIYNGRPEDINTDIISDYTHGIPTCHAEYADLSYDDSIKAVYFVCEVQYLASEYILHAYKTGDTSCLDADNLQVYNKAVDFIENKLDKNADDISKERQIHDYICEITEYFTDDSNEMTTEYIPNFRTVAGAFLDGRTNCMGYSDTFYTLASMAGFEVYRISSTDEMKHGWNVIVLDGKKYVVDVTWNDAHLVGDESVRNDYIYFNAGLDVIRQEYRYEPDDKVMQEVVQQCDENYFFAMNNSDYGYMTENYDEFYNKVCELIESGETQFRIACRNNVAGDVNDMSNKIFERLNKSIRLTGNLQNISGYSFAYISCEII